MFIEFCAGNCRQCFVRCNKGFPHSLAVGGVPFGNQRISPPPPDKPANMTTSNSDNASSRNEDPNPPRTQPNNPLHGVTLEAILNELVAHYGWAELGREIEIRCFTHDPSIASSLNFCAEPRGRGSEWNPCTSICADARTSRPVWCGAPQNLPSPDKKANSHR